MVRDTARAADDESAVAGLSLLVSKIAHQLGETIMRSETIFLTSFVLVSGLGMTNARADQLTAPAPGPTVVSSATLRGTSFRAATTKSKQPINRGVLSAAVQPIPAPQEDLSFESAGRRNQFPRGGPTRGFDLAVQDIRQQVVKPGRLVITVTIQNIGNTQFPGGQSALFTSFDEHSDARDRFDQDLTLGTVPIPILGVGESTQLRV